MNMHLSDRRIDKISLRKLCPEVFSDEDVSGSDIWLKNFAFVRGRDYTIEACSGSGKSSLCSFIYLNRHDFRGELLFDACDSRTFTTAEACAMRQRHIALVPQELRLFPELSAIDNIRLKNKLAAFRTEDEMLEMLDALGISSLAGRPVGQMSIGQMQRVAIVRALCQPFDFILLDEPVSHLDRDNNLAAANLILREARRQGASVITTSVGNPLIIPDAEIVRL